jgi:hypothetical protein
MKVLPWLIPPLSGRYERVARNKAVDRGSEDRMRNARSSSRSRNGGVVEDVLRSTRHLVAGTLLESVKEASREILRRALTMTLLYGVAVSLLGAGLILLLAAGFEALRLIPLPDAAASAIMGVVALGGGLAAVRAAGRKSRS